MVADKALSLKPSSVQEIPDLSPEHTAHDHSSARGLNVTNSRALIAHHLKSCFAQTVRNSKVHKYDSYHVISLHDKTSNVSHTDHHKENIDQGTKSIGGRASYLKQLPHLRGN